MPFTAVASVNAGEVSRAAPLSGVPVVGTGTDVERYTR